MGQSGLAWSSVAARSQAEGYQKNYQQMARITAEQFAKLQDYLKVKVTDLLELQEAWQTGGTSLGYLGTGPTAHLPSSSLSRTSAGCIAQREYPS